MSPWTCDLTSLPEKTSALRSASAEQGIASAAIVKIEISFIAAPELLLVSTDTFERNRIHVSIVLILSTHPPTEAIGLRTNTGVDRPARGDHYVAILHNNVARLLWRTH